MMGNIILLIAFVVEAAFAAYCIVTRSNQTRVRSLLRIGAFATFVLLTLVSLVQWGFRWYLLAALLFLWAVLGAVTLITRRAQPDVRPVKPGYPVGRSVVRAIATLLLVFIAATPALIFPQSTLPRPTGKHAVASASYTYTDPNRVETFGKTGGNRKVNVECWFPKDGAASGEKYPLVVFSHGAFGTKTSNTSTYLDLASNGYVVCAIDHPYHSMVTVDVDHHVVTADPSFLQEFLNANSGKYDDATDLQLEQKWMNLRVADIRFVLDTILQQANETGADAVYQMIDPQKIGLMGHSLGGEASAQVARERVASGQNDIDAVIDLDADLSGEYLGMQHGKPVINKEAYPVPLLVVFSDTLVRLMDAVPNANEVLAVKHILATDANAYEIDLPGTDHMSLTDLPLISPLMVSMINSSVPKGGGVEENPYATLEKMNGIVLQFFNVYLKGEGNFTAAKTE